MRKIIGAVFLSLDGVMQAPGGPTEDPTGGFKYGGWLPQFFDEPVGQRIDTLFGGEFDLLLGRRTYEIFAGYWPFAQGEEKSLGERFDRAAKHVVTRTNPDLTWMNSHRLSTLDAVAELKQRPGPNLIIQGSGTLYPQLLERGLLDELTLMSFPVVLGSGKRLFGEGTPAKAMRMTGHQVTAGGNVIATYEPDGQITPGSFDTQQPSALERARRARMAKGEW